MLSHSGCIGFAGATHRAMPGPWSVWVSCPWGFGLEHADVPPFLPGQRLRAVTCSDPRLVPSAVAKVSHAARRPRPDARQYMVTKAPGLSTASVEAAAMVPWWRKSSKGGAQAAVVKIFGLRGRERNRAGARWELPVCSARGSGIIVVGDGHAGGLPVPDRGRRRPTKRAGESRMMLAQTGQRKQSNAGDDTNTPNRGHHSRCGPSPTSGSHALTSSKCDPALTELGFPTISLKPLTIVHV